MLHLLIYRPELHDSPEPFEGIESLGLFEDEAAVNREITFWQQHGGRNWKFHYEDAPEQPVERWKRHAAELGEIHAKNAASWVTDGNESNESRRLKLTAIEDGDPAMDTMLPARPNLSGEWGDSYDGHDLIEEVTGRQPEDVPHEDREAIVNAWELSVDEHFIEECEDELGKWVN